MTTIAASSWSISVGGGWIVLMLIGMGLCFAFMLGFMWLMRGGCGWWTPGPGRNRDVSPESEA